MGEVVAEQLKRTGHRGKWASVGETWTFVSGAGGYGKGEKGGGGEDRWNKSKQQLFSLA